MLTISIINPEYSIGAEAIANGGNIPANGSWGIANKAFYFPFYFAKGAVIQKLWVGNGTTATGDVDMGIYSSVDFQPATRLASIGTTAQTGTSVLQEFDIADVTIKPQTTVFLALAFSSATSTVQSCGTPNFVVLGMTGVMQQTSAFPLPATATPAGLAINAQLPLCGMSARALVV